jgi:hypothetical protein
MKGARRPATRAPALWRDLLGGVERTAQSAGFANHLAVGEPAEHAARPVDVGADR